MEGEMSVERAIEVLDGQTKIWDHSLAYVNTMTVQCAIELGIPDVIQSHGRPITLCELITSLQISPLKSTFLARLMRMLVHLGYFIILQEQEQEQEQEKEKYAVGPLCGFLVKENPFNSSSFHLFMNDPIMVKPWRHLSSWFRTNDDVEVEQLPPFCLAHGGKRLYEVTTEDPGFGQLLFDALGRDSSLFSKVFVVKCRASFEGFSSPVDVGGNTGIIATAIVEAFPNIDCTLFNVPHLVSGQDQVDGKGDNLKFVGGDMFQEIPSADIVLLKWVLCDWGDESCMKILKQSKKAVTQASGGGGKVMIVDHVLGHKSWSDHTWTSTLLQFDMVDMACAEGSIRTEQQWAKLFLDAGFSDYTITPVHGLRVLIEVYP